MPRDSSGNYTLPAGNPVITGSTIASSWANTTLNDLASEMTDSLSRSGKGGMTASFKIQDGTVAAPGLAFTSEPGSGIYRIGAADIGFAVTGTEVLELQVGGIYAHQPFKTTAGNTAVTITGNATGSNYDFLVNANSSNGFAARFAGAAGSGFTTSYQDGKTSQEWWVAVSNAGNGVLSIRDNTAGINLMTFSPTNQNININTPFYVNGTANAYGLTVVGNATSGQSYGEFIRAGTNSSDNAFAVLNQANTVTYMLVRGDGITFISDNAASPATWKAGFRGSPPNVQGGNYTLVVADCGKSVVFSAAATLTLPQSIFSQGDMQIVVAQGGVVTIAAGSGVTLTWANASNTTGNRTLTNIGIATLWWESATQCYVTGSGLS